MSTVSIFDLSGALPDRADAIQMIGDAPLRLMAVHAHPDDESSKGAATMAKYAREGVDVMVCTLTGGERGDVLNKALDISAIRGDLPSIRRAEMALACDILGVRHRFLGFIDSGLPEDGAPEPLPDGCFAAQPLEVAASPLVAQVREFRPHVMLTYDESGGYPHPDHIMTHRVAAEAFGAAADPARYQDYAEPWQPLKLYYFVSFHQARRIALDAEMRARNVHSPHADPPDGTPDGPDGYLITTRVPCADYFQIRDEALIAHASQIEPGGPWFAYPLDVERAAWPTEDYHLARSYVGFRWPEDDLFAGIRQPVGIGQY